MTFYEEFDRLTGKYCWRSDTVFRLVASFDGVLEEIIETTINRKLEVVETNVQVPYERAPGHSIILDARCRESDGTIWDVEIQNASEGNLMRRMRFYEGVITSNTLPSSQSYKIVPNVCIIFITDFDPFSLGWSLYEVDKTLKAFTPEHREQLSRKAELVAKRLDSGERYYIVNAKSRDGSKLTKLLEELSKKEAVYPELFPKLCAMKNDFLNNQEEWRAKMISIESERDRRVCEQEDIRLTTLLTALKDRLLAEGKLDELLRAIADREYRNELVKFYFPNGVPGTEYVPEPW